MQDFVCGTISRGGVRKKWVLQKKAFSSLVARTTQHHGVPTAKHALGTRWRRCCFKVPNLENNQSGYVTAFFWLYGCGT